MLVAWLNRIGLSIQFLALFLVTPEVLGEEKVSTLAATFWVRPGQAVSRLYHRSSLFRLLAMLPVAALALLLGLSGWLNLLDTGNYLLDALVSLLVALVVGWLLTRGVRLITRLTSMLINSDRSFLPVGALLFTAGFICLMWATFLPQR